MLLEHQAEVYLKPMDEKRKLKTLSNFQNKERMCTHTLNISPD